jgi:hypothetical protein
MKESTLNRQAAGNHPRAARLPGRFSPAFACAALAIALAAGAAGCASNSVSSGPVGTLRVTVIQAGGPALPGGKTPTSPLANTEVEVTAGGASSTAETDKAGIATCHLAYGTYLVSVASCGSTTGQSVTVATAAARLTWTCPVP